jgi:outer membrane protein TolC
MRKLKIILFAFLLTFQAYAQTDSLSYYLETAGQNNPGVQAAFLTYQAALQRVPQMGAYQDPQLDMGFFLRPMELVDGRQIAEFRLMQMFPWFGVRKAARTEAQHMAKMAFEQFREARDNLFSEVYTQWFTLCRLQQQLINNRDNKQLLLQLEELALQKFKVGTVSAAPMPSTQMPQSAGNASSTNGGMSGMGMSGSSASVSSPDSQFSILTSQVNMGGASSGMSGILLIRLEISELENNIESILSEIRSESVKFNALLNRSSDSAIQLPDTLTQLPFLLNEEAVMEEIKRQNPMLGMMNEEESAYKAKAEMDRKMSYPMWGIGLQYMLIAPLKAAADPMAMDAGTGMSAMNGKDMVMPMVSVGIPLYRNKYKAQQRETAFLLQANREKYADALNRLEAELYRIKHQLDDAARNSALYQKQSELAQSVYTLTLQEFVSGGGALSEVIRVQRQLLDYKLKTAEAIADYNSMTAAIQKLISSNNE